MAKRCREGDLVKIVNSFNSALIGRTGIITRWMDEHDRWGVTVFGSPEFAKSIRTGFIFRTTAVLFRDSSLVPLRGDELETDVDKRGVIHG